MVTMNVSREVEASPPRVWTVITDIEASPEVLSGVERVERLDGGEGFGVGTRWRETRTMFGREATEEMEVTSLEAGRSYTTCADSRGARYTSVLRLEPLGADRTLLSMSFSAIPGGAAGRLLAATVGRLFEGATRRMLARDLDDIAATAEGRSGG